VELDTDIPCEWAWLKRFSKSQVKGQGCSETTYAFPVPYTVRWCGVETDLFNLFSTSAK